MHLWFVNEHKNQERRKSRTEQLYEEYRLEKVARMRIRVDKE